MIELRARHTLELGMCGRITWTINYMNILVWKHTEDIDREKEEGNNFTETKQQDKRPGGTKPHGMFGGKLFTKSFSCMLKSRHSPPLSCGCLNWNGSVLYNNCHEPCICIFSLLFFLEMWLLSRMDLFLYFSLIFHFNLIKQFYFGQVLFSHHQDERGELKIIHSIICLSTS